MKQGIYFFSKLSPTEQEQFRTNFLSDYNSEEFFEKYLDDEFPSKIFFIMCAFTWRDTDEGVEYWKQISKRKD